MRGFKALFWVACLAACAKVSVAHAASPTAKSLQYPGYARTLVYFEREDASSTFSYIYFLDAAGEPQYAIHVWNGGCCQAPLIEEFSRAKRRFKLIASYATDEKPEDFPGMLLCTPNLKKTPREPSHEAVKGFAVAQIPQEHLHEAEVFKGCK